MQDLLTNREEANMLVRFVETENREEGVCHWYLVDGREWGYLGEGNIIDTNGAPVLNENEPGIATAIWNARVKASNVGY